MQLDAIRHFFQHLFFDIEACCRAGHVEGHRPSLADLAAQTWPRRPGRADPAAQTLLRGGVTMGLRVCSRYGDEF